MDRLKLITKENNTEDKTYTNFYLKDTQTGLELQIKPTFKRDYNTIKALFEMTNQG